MIVLLVVNVAFGSFAVAMKKFDRHPFMVPAKLLPFVALGPLLLSMVDVQAQQDTVKVVDLKEVRISGTHTSTGVDRLPEVDGTVIYAGKKNEVIVLDAMDADLSTNNVRQVLAKVPGLSVWENDGSGIQVGVAARGLSPNRSWEFNVRQDGFDISAEMFGYPEAYYSPPMEAVERIELVRGAASLQYGPQFGGLLNYRMKKGDPTKPVVFETKQTMGSNGLFNSYNAIGGTKGKFSYYGFWHHRSADGWRANSRYTTNTGHFSMNYALNAKIKLGLEYTRMDYESQQPGGHTDGSFAMDPRASTRERNWFTVPWNVAALTAEVAFNDRAHLDVKVFTTVAERSSVGFVRPINEPDTFITALGSKAPRQVDRDEYNNTGVEVRFLQGYQLAGQQSHLAVGVRGYYGHTQRHQKGIGTTGSDLDLTLTEPGYGRELDLTTSNLAMFAENQFKIGSRLSVVPGMRYEFIRSTVEGYLNTSTTGTLPYMEQTRQLPLFGIGSEFRTTATTEVYANYSQAYRPVLFSELTPSATTDIIDPDLKDASGYNLDFGYRGKINKNLTFDVGGFVLEYKDRIGTVDVDGTAFRTNVGSSLSKGIEAYVEIDPLRMLFPESRWGGVRLFASVGLIDAKYTKWNNPAIVDDPARSIVGKRVENAPERIERYGLTYLYERFSATFQFNSISDVYTDAANTEESNAAATIGRIAGYQVMDLSATCSFRKGLELKVGVNNLADEAYATRRAGGYPGPGLLPSNGRTMYISIGARF